MKNRGPRTDPCGTPDFIDNLVEEVFLPSQQSDVTGMSQRYHKRCQNLISL